MILQSFPPVSDSSQDILPQCTLEKIFDRLGAQRLTSCVSVYSKAAMPVPDTRQGAKELVQRIAKNHGYLGKERLRALDPELRRDIEEAFLRKDELIGSSVIT